ncbi:MAG: hypothetical protein P9X24_10975 [Candidatus Hatepunaea meridiana]|nr:hypothetical protein [Candidatus Hatepunaea meridiana]
MSREKDESKVVIEAYIDSELDKNVDPGFESLVVDNALLQAQVDQLRSTTKLRESFAKKVYKV